MVDGPKPGAPAVCDQCGNDIVFVGPYWDHVGELKPRHPAFPQKVNPASGLMPAEQRAMDALLAAWEAFKSIPDSLPVTEVQKFRDAIHDAQYVLTSLVVRRDYPDYWR